jgi:hypothetical protein
VEACRVMKGIEPAPEDNEERRPSIADMLNQLPELRLRGADSSTGAFASAALTGTQRDKFAAQMNLDHRRNYPQYTVTAGVLWQIVMVSVRQCLHIWSPNSHFLRS